MWCWIGCADLFARINVSCRNRGVDGFVLTATQRALVDSGAGAAKLEAHTFFLRCCKRVVSAPRSDPIRCQDSQSYRR